MIEEEMKNTEEALTLIREYSMGFLTKGRAWDVPHTEAVFHFSKLISEAEGADVLVIAAAALLHDTGYYGQFDDGFSNDRATVMSKKELHMVEGARLARELFERPEMMKYLTQKEADRAVHLVFVHDRIEQLKDLDELILMEADTLGAIDLSRVTPTFNKEGGLKYIEGLYKRRIPKFTTETGKQQLEELLPKFVSYFEEM